MEESVSGSKQYKRIKFNKWTKREIKRESSSPLMIETVDGKMLN